MNERIGNPRPLKGSGDEPISGNPRLLHDDTEAMRVPSSCFEAFGVDPNVEPTRKNWSNLCRTVWALINNPDLIVGRDNSRIRWPEFPQKTKGSSSESSSSSSSQSSSSSSSSSSAPSSSAASSGQSESTPSDSESDKSTAIVPAPWLPSGYTALFCLESPEVRFDDVVTFELWKRTEMRLIDHRFVKVCEPGTIRVCGFSVDQPLRVGILPPAGESLWFRLSWGWFERPAWPVRVTVRLTGIRKGFRGKRFPVRTREQFEANEEFINSAYPGTPSPPDPKP